MTLNNETIQVEDTGETLILTIRVPKMWEGTVCESIGREMIAAAEHAAGKNIVVDLGCVALIASVGVSPFLRLKRQVDNAGGRLVLCNFQDFVRQIFQTTHLLAAQDSNAKAPFDWAETKESALAMVAQS